jgi:hypothetical protein
MNIFAAAVDFFFGCHHRHLSRVFTIDSRTYRVCCDCGAKLGYSLERMSFERASSRPCHIDAASYCVRWRES